MAHECSKVTLRRSGGGETHEEGAWPGQRHQLRRLRSSEEVEPKGFRFLVTICVDALVRFHNANQGKQAPARAPRPREGNPQTTPG